MNPNWKYVEFEKAVEICDNLRKPVNSKERATRIDGKREDELYPYYGATGQVGYIDDYISDGEYVLLGEDGAPFLNPFAEKAYLITGKTWVNNHAHVLKSKTNNKFLMYYLNSINYRDYVSGTTRLKLTQGQMKHIFVPIPPEEEQEKIVLKIEELFSQIDEGVKTLEKTSKQLHIYRESVLNNIFSRLEETNNCKLGDVIDVLTDYHSNGSYETLKEHVTLLDEPSYAIMIRSTNFEKNDFKKDLKYIDENAYNFLKKSQLYGGEILMGKIGNAGRVYYMKKMDKPTSLAMNMFAMRFIEAVDSEYVYYYLKSPKASADIKQYVKGVGTPTIDKKSVRSIKFAYPSLEEQRRIVEEIKSRLSICDELEKTVEVTLVQTYAMKLSVLKQAFEGGLV